MTKPLADAARAVVPTDVVVDGRGVRWYEVPVEQIDNLRAALAGKDAEVTNDQKSCQPAGDSRSAADGEQMTQQQQVKP